MRFSLSSVTSLASILIVTASACAEPFTLFSHDIAGNQHMGKAQEFNGFGCDGDNLSPQLSWSGAPEGTEAYAVFAYDPDAPTGSGWWHWQVINIPKNVTFLATGAGDASGDNLPEGSRHIANDFGVKGFGGACPPEGHGAHRYQFTVFALPSDLTLPDDPSGALTGYMVKANALASATIEALYERK